MVASDLLQRWWEDEEVQPIEGGEGASDKEVQPVEQADPELIVLRKSEVLASELLLQPLRYGEVQPVDQEE